MFSNHIAPAMLPTNSLMGFIKKNLRDRRNDKMKKFILHFLKASDFNISDISIHDEEIKINSDMESFTEKQKKEKELQILFHLKKSKNIWKVTMEMDVSILFP